MIYKSWIEETKTGLDYYSAFIKTWIAFNSWYNDKYKDLEPNTDRNIINEIKAVENSFRSEFIHLLKNDPSYFEYVDLLHLSLTKTSIETRNFNGVSESISLSNIAITNKQRNIDDKRYDVKYEIRRTNKKYKLSITNSHNKKIFGCEQDTYSLEDLERINPSQWKDLSNTQKTHLKSLYKKLNPFVIISLINNTADDDYIKSGQNKYTNNYERIAEALIEALYLLRCALFHGQISAKEDTKDIYKHAYNLLNPVIQKL